MSEAGIKDYKAWIVFKNYHPECHIKNDPITNKPFLITIFRKEDGAVSFDSPLEMLESVLLAYGIEIGKEKDFIRRFELACAAKRDIVHYIARFTNEFYHQKLESPYNYSNVLVGVEQTIADAKTELDLNKYKLEVKKLRIETGWYITATFLLAVLTFVVNQGSCNKSKNNYKNELQSGNKTFILKQAPKSY